LLPLLLLLLLQVGLPEDMDSEELDEYDDEELWGESVTVDGTLPTTVFPARQQANLCQCR
jgi:hypothetical protein